LYINLIAFGKYSDLILAFTQSTIDVLVTFTIKFKYSDKWTYYVTKSDL